MKKYKLIKEYLGSPMLNTEIVESIITGSRPKFRTFTISGHNKHCDMGKFRIDNPEISPEYWKEVDEKEYEILSIEPFTAKPCFEIYNISHSNYQLREGDKILSIKRLSDGMVFTVGALVTDGTQEGKILRMRVTNNGLYQFSCSKENGWYEFTNYKVIEKEYEILSFKHKGSNHIWKNDSQLKYTFCIIDGKAPFTSLEEINRYPKVYEIHSVKRLSDGEIFTVGDEIFSTNWNCTHINKKSDTLVEISLNNEFMFKTKITWQCDLEDIRHYKKPLFTTEDGVDIFEGSIIYLVEDSLDGICKRIASEHYKGSNSQHPVDHWYKNDKYFSTKQAAEEYILMNKPCLSLNDVFKVYPKFKKKCPTSFTHHANLLIELVKSKL